MIKRFKYTAVETEDNSEEYNYAAAVKVKKGQLITLVICPMKDGYYVASVGPNAEESREIADGIPDSNTLMGVIGNIEFGSDDDWGIYLFNSEEDAVNFTSIINDFYNNVVLKDFITLLFK